MASSVQSVHVPQIGGGEKPHCHVTALMIELIYYMHNSSLSSEHFVKVMMNAFILPLIRQKIQSNIIPSPHA